MVDWAAAKALTFAATASVFDTVACRLLPMIAPSGGRDVNARPVADGGRAEFEFLASVDLEPSQDSIPRHLPVDPGVNGKIVAFDACVTALVSGWAYLPKRGDRIRVTDTVIGTKTLDIKLDRRDGSMRMAFYGNWID